MLTLVNPEEPVPAAVPEPAAPGGSLIDEIVRDGARRMLAAALEAEVAAYIAAQTGRFANVDPARVVTKEDATLLVEAMADDLRRYPDEWENGTLERFLEALAASLESGRDWPEKLGRPALIHQI